MKTSAGFVLAAVLVCLAVVSVMAVVMVRVMATGQRQVRQHQREMQALWLVESAIDRSAAALASDASWPGETWRIEADRGPGGAPAVVQIDVEGVAQRPAQRRLRISARLGPAGPRQVSESRTHTLQLAGNEASQAEPTP